MLRTLTQQDLPELATLRTAAGARVEQQQRAQDAMLKLYPQLFFHTPFSNPDLPGLVTADADDRLTGMIAIGKRPMLFQGQPISAAIGADLYVDENARSSMAGVTLIKGLLDGPQDVTVCDIANGSTRRLWERLGGFVAPAYNLNWIGVLRPAQLAARLVRERRGLALPGRMLMTCSVATDRFLPDRLRCRFAESGQGLTETALTPDLFSTRLQELTQEEAVQPVFCRDSAQWMWRRLPFLSPESGEISGVALSNSRGRLLGWYLYELGTGGVARVLQIAAKSRDAAAVVNHLFAHVADRGAAAVAGRMQPRFQQILIDLGCLLRGRETYTLIHSRNPQIAAAFRGGSAWLSMLDGEAPLNAWNDPAAASRALDGLPDNIRRFGLVDS